MNEKTYGTQQIAEFAMVSPSTVKKWIKDGLLKAHSLPSSNFKRVTESELLRFFELWEIPIPSELGGSIQVLDNELYNLKEELLNSTNVPSAIRYLKERIKEINDNRTIQEAQTKEV